jgi:hypothetical protein
MRKRMSKIEVTVRRVFLAVLATIVAPPAEAEMFGPDYQRCGDKPNTLAIVECLQANQGIGSVVECRL